MAPTSSHQPRSAALPIVGWREWVSLPDFSVPHIKAKIDTGARTSALHAYGLERFERDGKPWVRFEIHPMQRSGEKPIPCETEVVDERRIRSSTGHVVHRPAILTTLEILGQSYEIEMTLAARDAMGFRMLLGRRALRGRFTVDPGRSFFGGRPDGVRRRRRRRPPKERDA